MGKLLLRFTFQASKSDFEVLQELNGAKRCRTDRIALILNTKRKKSTLMTGSVCGVEVNTYILLLQSKK